MKSHRYSFESHLSGAVLIAGLLPCHDCMMNGRIGHGLLVLGAACLAAIMIAAAGRLIRVFHELPPPPRRPPDPPKGRCNFDGPDIK
jgi:hypothetical protein